MCASCAASSGMRRRSSRSGAWGTRCHRRRTHTGIRRKPRIVLRSLRVRLPLVFLAGIILAGLVTAAISVRLFQDFAHDQTLRELSREANGVTQLYSSAIRQSYGNKSDRLKPAVFTAKSLERATGDRLYYVGPNFFPGQGITGLGPL